MTQFTIIAAVDEAGGIGRSGALPWRLPGELRHFREVTTGTGRNAVIMGRTTWHSIPQQYRPLPRRLNIVLTARPEATPGATTVQSIAAARQAAERADCREAFFIGGGQVYAAAIGDPAVRRLLITRVAGTHDCDVFFPAIPPSFRRIDSSRPIVEAGETYWYEEYRTADAGIDS